MLLKKNNSWRDEEPLVENVVKAFAGVMTDNIKENIAADITRMLQNPYNNKSKKAFIDAFNKVFEGKEYSLNIQEFKDIH